MSLSRRHLAVALVALASAPSAAIAQVTCGLPDEVFTQCPMPVGFSVTDKTSGYSSADDFVLLSAAGVDHIRWWGTYADAGGSISCGEQTDDFTVRVWGDTGGNGPDENVLVADVSAFSVTRSANAVGQFMLGPSTFSVFEYELDLAGAPVSLSGGVRYWLEIQNDLTLTAPACGWAWVLGPIPGNGFYSHATHWPIEPPWSVGTFPFATPGYDFSFCLSERGGGPVSYCTSGTSTSGCSATVSASGGPSATASSGFLLFATSVEGLKQGLFFYGANGRQANPWGNGTSYQCVVPPVKRGGLLAAVGSAGGCDGSFAQDLNARWCPTCPKPTHNPGAGAVVQAQLWYRDPFNTSNQTTGLSDAIEFTVGP